MSEKPFWEGKTCKEMAGLHVKATWKNGTIVTGVLDDTGDIELCDNRSLYTSRSYDSSCDFEPIDNIQSIELLDDPEYERVNNIEDVHVGDIFVANDGNQYLIDAEDKDDKAATFGVYLSYAGEMQLSNCAFAYALRPKPKLPDKPGLWIDKNGNEYIVNSIGCSARIVYYASSNSWRVNGDTYSLQDDGLRDAAPFRSAISHPTSGFC